MILQTRTRKRKTKIVSKEMIEKLIRQAETVDARTELIQMLIPLGLEAVGDALQKEVQSLAGAEYSRDGIASRWVRGQVFL